MTYTVKVIEIATEEVVTIFTAKSERQAKKIEDGLLININHHDYYTVIEELPL
jgi:hypothetical protein